MNQSQNIQKKETEQAFWNYLSVFAGRFGSALLSVLLLALIARKLLPEGYGRFSLFLMVANFISLIFLNWPNSAVIRFGKESFIQKKNISEVIGSVLIIFLCTYSLSIILTLVFKNSVEAYIGKGTGLFLLLFIFVFTSMFYDLLPYVLQSIGKMKVYGFLPLIEKSATLIFFLFFIYFKKLTAIDVIIIYLLGQVIMIIVAILYLEKKYILPLKYSFEYLRKIVGYSWPMIFGAVSAFLISWIDVIIIKKYFQISDVGMYSLAYRGMTFFLTLSISTTSLAIPMVISFRTLSQPNLLNLYIDELIPQGVFLFSILISAVIVISGPVIFFVLGPAYSNSVLPFVVLIAGVSFNSIGCFYSGFISAYDLILKSVAISVFLSVVKILGSLILIPKYDLVGAAFATTFAFTICNLLYIKITNNSGHINSNNKRYLSAFWASLPLFNLTGYFLLKGLGARVIFFLVSLSVFLIISKKTKLFKEKTLVLIDCVEMPLVLKENIKKIYKKFL